MSKIEQTSILKLKFQIEGIFNTISRYLLFLIGLLVLVFCYLEYRRVGWLWYAWDFMFISGLATFVFALYLARSIPSRMNQTLSRLTNRGAFQVAPQGVGALQVELYNRSQLFGTLTSITVGIAILLSFLVAYGDLTGSKLSETILETFLGMVAGYYIGQMVAYGTLGQIATKKRIPIVAQPGHIDRAAGLKPIGDFYFFQAMLVAIPSVFLAVWWVIIPILTPWYSHWRNPYLGLLVFALIFEILSFILPMWSFHLIMKQQKIDHLTKADQYSQEILDLEARIINVSDAKNAKELQERLDFLKKQYWEIEQMPTWPVDALTRRRFTINNIFLFLPFILDLISASERWKKFLNILIQLLGEES